MLRSMYSAISGMQAFETKLDVIGNNIANVNTTGFKTGVVDFADVLSQTMSGSSAPIIGGKGGTNPQQIGLGVRLAGIQTIFTQGADQTTGNPLDVALNGTGFLTVSPTGNANNLMFTRAGSLSIDANGNLVTPDGSVLMAFSKNTGLVSNTTTSPTLLHAANLGQLASLAGVAYGGSTDVQIGPDGSINVLDSTGNRQTIGYLAISTVSNPGGLTKMGNSLYQVTSNSGNPSFSMASTNNVASLQSGALEMSNVDLTREFAEMIVAQRGFDANSKMIGTDNAILNDIVNLKNG